MKKNTLSPWGYFLSEGEASCREIFDLGLAMADSSGGTWRGVSRS